MITSATAVELHVFGRLENHISSLSVYVYVLLILGDVSNVVILRVLLACTVVLIVLFVLSGGMF